MVQMSQLAPFKLNNFNTMIKTNVVFFLIGLLLYIVTEENIQKERSVFFIILFFVLLLVIIIGKSFFLSKKHEKLGLWMLYLNMTFSSIGFPLLAYATEVSQNLEIFIFNCVKMLFASLIVNIYFVIMKNYVRKLFSERIFAYVAGIPLVILLSIPAVLMILDDENFINALLWGGIICLSITIAQYPRIGAYFEQKNMKRYGNSLDIVNKKKEGEKK